MDNSLKLQSIFNISLSMKANCKLYIINYSLKYQVLFILYFLIRHFNYQLHTLQRFY